MLNLLCGTKRSSKYWLIGLNKLLTQRQNKILCFFAIIQFKSFVYLVSFWWRLDKLEVYSIEKDRFYLINCYSLANSWLKTWIVNSFNIFLWRLIFLIGLSSNSSLITLMNHYFKTLRSLIYLIDYGKANIHMIAMEILLIILYWLFWLLILLRNYLDNLWI